MKRLAVTEVKYVYVMNEWMRLINETPEDQLNFVVNGYRVEDDKRFFDSYHMLIAASEFRPIVEERLRKSTRGSPHHICVVADYDVAISNDLRVFSVITLEHFGPPQETFYLEWTKDEDGEVDTLPAKNIFELREISLTKMKE